MPAIYFSHDFGEEQDVCVLLTEYAQDQYVLVVCLKNGDSHATPPVVLLRVKVPHEKVTFDAHEKSGVISVSDNDVVSYIRCTRLVDFWELMRIICTAKRLDAVRELTIDVLVDDAIRNIPVGVTPPAAGGVQSEVEVGIAATEEHAEEEDGPEHFEMARNGDEDTVVGEM